MASGSMGYSCHGLLAFRLTCERKLAPRRAHLRLELSLLCMMQGSQVVCSTLIVASGVPMPASGPLFEIGVPRIYGGIIRSGVLRRCGLLAPAALLIDWGRKGMPRKCEARKVVR